MIDVHARLPYYRCLNMKIYIPQGDTFVTGNFHKGQYYLVTTADLTINVFKSSPFLIFAQ